MGVTELIGNLFDRPIRVLTGQLSEPIDQNMIPQFAKSQIEDGLNTTLDCTAADAHLCRDSRCGRVKIVDKHQMRHRGYSVAVRRRIPTVRRRGGESTGSASGHLAGS